MLHRLRSRQAERLIEAVCGRSLDELLDEPTYALDEDQPLADLLAGRAQLRLDLDPRQEAALAEIRVRSGPFIITGGPGTGKSVLALYAVKALLERLRAAGLADPRILLVTYTRTLKETTEWTLRQAFDSRDRFAVTVQTLDQMVEHLVGGVAPQVVESQRRDDLFKQVRAQAFSQLLSPTA